MMRVAKCKIDTCPLCNKELNYRQKSKNVKVVYKDTTLFFAHKECLEIMDTFISKVGEIDG
jgi:hypothetical protein